LTDARPLVGLTTYVEAASWGPLWRDLPCALLPQAYPALVERAGGIPVLLPPADPALAPALVSRLDALITTGGPDVDPARYGEPAHPRTGVPQPVRDGWEAALIGAALDAGLPLLGICRGMQLLNVVRGGSLDQHLPDRVGHEGHNPVPGAFPGHPVRALPGTRLAELLGPGELDVPTHHHQAVSRLGEGLRPAAVSPADGVVEAVEADGPGFALAVQWHPEMGDDLRVLRALVDAAAAHAAAPRT